MTSREPILYGFAHKLITCAIHMHICLDLSLLVYTGTTKKQLWKNICKIFTRCQSNIVENVQKFAVEKVKKCLKSQARPRLEPIPSKYYINTSHIVTIYASDTAR